MSDWSGESGEHVIGPIEIERLPLNSKPTPNDSQRLEQAKQEIIEAVHRAVDEIAGPVPMVDGQMVHCFFCGQPHARVMILESLPYPIIVTECAPSGGVAMARDGALVSPDA